MNSIAILLSDFESINESIIIKSFNKIKKSKIKKIYIIGDKNKFRKLYNKIHNIKKIKFINYFLNNNNPFKYTHGITDIAIDLLKKKKINYLINMPLNKKKYLKNFKGYTEFFSNKINKTKKYNMLLYNKNFSVCPLTTHIEIKKVDKEISKKNIFICINNVLEFYKKIIKKKIKIVILGLNPHASKDFNKTKDQKILIPVVKYFKNKGIDISGPTPADTAFNNEKGKIYIGMYHDQVLIPFKMKNKFDGINITIGNKFIRMSPDHGPAKDLKTTKRKINNQSFLNCIKFCEIY